MQGLYLPLREVWLRIVRAFFAFSPQYEERNEKNNDGNGQKDGIPGFSHRLADMACFGMAEAEKGRQAVVQHMDGHARNQTSRAVIKPGQRHARQRGGYYLRWIQVKNAEYEGGEKNGFYGAITLQQRRGDGSPKQQFFNHGAEQTNAENAHRRGLQGLESLLHPVGQKSQERHQEIYPCDGSHAHAECGRKYCRGGEGISLPVAVKMPLPPEIKKHPCESD